MNKIRVHLEKKVSRSYEICIGRQILDRMGLILAKGSWAQRYFVVTDSAVSAVHGPRVLDTLRWQGLGVELLDFPAGEPSKTIGTCLALIDRMLALGADRTSALIALGGGVVGDLAGFVASVFMRGIPYVQVPTTLLAQVDSAIGGKTGVDLPAGKNLLGSFYQPKGVFIDLDFLETLSEGEFRNGLAEIIKCGVIEDPELLNDLEAHAASILRRDMAQMEHVVARSCRIKKAIVEIDESEKGLRRLLNFGHTVGHALEAGSNYTLSHGEAVSIGMVASAVLSERLKYLPREDRERIEAVLTDFGLPTRIPKGADTAALLSFMRRDKKKQGGAIHFVLLKKIGLAFVNGGAPEGLVEDVIESLREP